MDGSSLGKPFLPVSKFPQSDARPLKNFEDPLLIVILQQIAFTLDVHYFRYFGLSDYLGAPQAWQLSRIKS